LLNIIRKQTDVKIKHSNCARKLILAKGGQKWPKIVKTACYSK